MPSAKTRIADLQEPCQALPQVRLHPTVRISLPHPPGKSGSAKAPRQPQLKLPSEIPAAAPPPRTPLHLITGNKSASEPNGCGISGGYIDHFDVAEAVARVGWAKEADELHNCGLKGCTMRCKTCGHTWVQVYMCHNRLCPVCGAARSARLADVHRALTTKTRLKHLVLTFTALPKDPYDWVAYAHKSFNKLRHRSLFKRSWRGGVSAVEFSYRGNGRFHMHIHALIDGEFIPQAVISKAWEDIVHNAYVVWISEAHNSREVLKYILKPSKALLADDDALAAFLTAITGHRLVTGWGCHYRFTEKSLIPPNTCPACGNGELERGESVIWSEYNGQWVARAPPET